MGSGYEFGPFLDKLRGRDPFNQNFRSLSVAVDSRAREKIRLKFPEISVQNSMDRFGPAGKVSKKLVHLLRWSSFPGRTGLNFGWMDRASKRRLPGISRNAPCRPAAKWGKRQKQTNKQKTTKATKTGRNSENPRAKRAQWCTGWPCSPIVFFFFFALTQFFFSPYFPPQCAACPRLPRPNLVRCCAVLTPR